MQNFNELHQAFALAHLEAAKATLKKSTPSEVEAIYDMAFDDLSVFLKDKNAREFLKLVVALHSENLINELAAKTSEKLGAINASVSFAADKAEAEKAGII